MQIISLVKHNFFKRSFRVTLDWQLRGVLHITLRIYQLISSSCYVLYALFVAYLPALNGQFSIQQAHSSIMEVLSVSSSMFLLWKLLKSQYLRVFVKPMRVFLFVLFDDKKQIMLLYTICQQREVPGPRLMLKYHYVDANQTAKA